MAELYNCKSVKTGWRMVKFDGDLNVQSVYELSGGHGRINCQCFQANKESCRHRVMLDIFLKSKAVDTKFFLDYEEMKWVPYSGIDSP